MKYIFFNIRGDFQNYLFKDFLDRDDVFSYYFEKEISNPFLKIIRKIHLSRKVNKIINLPFKSIWYEEKNLSEKVDGNSVFLFTTADLGAIRKDFLYELKKKYPANKKVVLALDSVHAHSWCMKYALPFMNSFPWDLIISYDHDDCEEFGYKFLGYCYYSKINANNDEKLKESDLQFIGAVKNDNGEREKAIGDIFRKAQAEKIKCDFVVQGKYQGKSINGITMIDKSMEYPEVLNHVLHSKCILELLQSGQKMQTARYFEAIIYNKKLLTNNPNIKELPFYNPEYMYYFKTVDDIDFKKIREDSEVNYNYNNEFSSSHLAETIDRYLSEK